MEMKKMNSFTISWASGQNRVTGRSSESGLLYSTMGPEPHLMGELTWGREKVIEGEKYSVYGVISRGSTQFEIALNDEGEIFKL